MKIKINEKKYSYRVIWSEKDKEFVGTCAEFPGLSISLPDQQCAFFGIVKAVKLAIETMEQENRKPSKPILLSKFSGKFKVSTTPEVHKRLTILAGEAGMDLNQYVIRMSGVKE